jgi:subtilisin family serine protease
VGDHSDTGRSDVSSDSHGTSVTAIIAGTGNGDNGQGMIGLAPHVKILPVRISVDRAIEPIALAEAVRYAVDHRAQIINISDATPDPNPTLRAAIGYALNHNVIVVAAAGNNGRQGNPLEYPGSFPGVVNVAGIDQAETAWPQSESGPNVSLAAPAVNIYSAADNGGYLTGDGTSYAAPYVSATAALLWSLHPHATAGQIIHQMISSAVPAGDRPHDDHYGFGIVNPLNALTTPLTTDTTNPLLVPPAPAADTNSLPIWLMVIIAAVLALVVFALVSVLLRRRRRTAKATPAPSPATRTPVRRSASQRPPRVKK